jgi:predicted aspartyl protease
MLGLFQRLQVLAMAVSVVPAVLCAQASDTKDKATFAAGDRKATFGFDWRNGMIFIPVRLNGSRPLSFVLDTGSTKMIVDRALATSLGLKAGGSGSLQGAGAGRIPIEFIHNVSIALPGIESTGYEFSTADLQPLETSLGVRVDGILGYELFSRFVVTVDFEAKTMTLNSPGAFPISNAAQEIPIELRDKWAFVKAELVFPGSVTVQDAFLIDTGSSDAVDHPIVMKLENRVPATSGVGLGAQIQGATARATSFRLGRYSITAPTVSCCGASDATSKLIGNEVLQRFTVIFDYPSSRIFIEPNSYFEKPLRPTN